MATSDSARYNAALHAMQTGVQHQMEVTNETNPKHLRVGVNSALSNLSGLARLLMDKGIITEDEYRCAVADAMEREAADYTERVRKQYSNDNITLG